MTLVPTYDFYVIYEKNLIGSQRIAYEKLWMVLCYEFNQKKKKLTWCLSFYPLGFAKCKISSYDYD